MKDEWSRKFATDLAIWNGAIPAGPCARLAAIFLATCFVKRAGYTPNPLSGGSTIRELLSPLGLSRSGGPKSGAERIREQLRRFMEMEINVSDKKTGEGYRVAADPGVFLREFLDAGGDPLRMPAGWTPEFERDLQRSAVPIDLRAVRAFQKDCLALDLYFFLTWKAYSLKKEFAIPLFFLQKQIGNGFKEGSSRMFRLKVAEALVKVRQMYPDVRVVLRRGHLVLIPCPPHVRPKEPPRYVKAESSETTPENAPSTAHSGRGPPAGD